MAIDPTLVLQLLQNTPYLLNSFKKAYPIENNNNTGGAGIIDALERGYDPNLIQQQLVSNSNVYDGIISPMEITAADYMFDLGNSDIKQRFKPNTIDVNGYGPETIKSLALKLLNDNHKIQSPARASALSMLSNDPLIGYDDIF